MQELQVSTIGTQTITLDPSSDIIQVGTGITIDANNEKIIVGSSELADATGNSGSIVTALNLCWKRNVNCK